MDICGDGIKPGTEHLVPALSLSTKFLSQNSFLIVWKGYAEYSDT